MMLFLLCAYVAFLLLCFHKGWSTARKHSQPICGPESRTDRESGSTR